MEQRGKTTSSVASKAVKLVAIYRTGGCGFLASLFSISEMASRFQCFRWMERAESKAATCFLYRRGVMPAQPSSERLRRLKAKRNGISVLPSGPASYRKDFSGSHIVPDEIEPVASIAECVCQTRPGNTSKIPLTFFWAKFASWPSITSVGHGAGGGQIWQAFRFRSTAKRT